MVEFNTPAGRIGQIDKSAIRKRFFHEELSKNRYKSIRLRAHDQEFGYGAVSECVLKMVVQESA